MKSIKNALEGKNAQSLYAHTHVMSKNRTLITSKSDQIGRSMVEMLGVLAIIGVISVGGIAGYNYGMSRYRTNEVLDGANKRAYTVATWRGIGNPDLSEFSGYDTTPGGTFKDSVTRLENNQFAIFVDSVQKETCVNMIKSIGNKTPILRITTQDDTNTALTIENCRDGDNQLALIFDNNLEPQGTLSGGSGEEPQTPNPPSCLAYPGTSPDGAGGIAGKADDGTTDCRCPIDKGWTTVNNKCLDNVSLYVRTDERKNHLDWVAGGVNGYCPSGYHWASINEVVSDFNCQMNSLTYTCDKLNSAQAWLKECAKSNNTNMAQISCDEASQAFAVRLSKIFYTVRSIGTNYALCRRD